MNHSSMLGESLEKLLWALDPHQSVKIYILEDGSYGVITDLNREDKLIIHEVTGEIQGDSLSILLQRAKNLVSETNNTVAA